MSEISDEGLLPPNVHHVHPKDAQRADGKAHREPVEGREDPKDESPAADERRPQRETTDDPYAKKVEDAEPPKGSPTPEATEPGGDEGRVDGRTGEEGTGDEDDG